MAKLIIVPEWNVKQKAESDWHSAAVLIIVPEWNVKYELATPDGAGNWLIIVPEWNVKGHRSSIKITLHSNNSSRMECKVVKDGVKWETIRLIIVPEWNVKVTM